MLNIKTKSGKTLLSAEAAEEEERKKKEEEKKKLEEEEKKELESIKKLEEEKKKEEEEKKRIEEEERKKLEEKKKLEEEQNSVSKNDEKAEEDFEEEEEEFKGEVLEETKKKHCNIVFIGHVDAGKSTLCGHVLYLAGCVDARTIEQYKIEAEGKSRSSWYWSYVMDLSDEERAKGKTEEVGVAHFETEVNKYTVLDAPGHRSFVPQMIGGAVQADIAVLVVSARTGEFEAGFERGGQTYEHLLIAKTAGVRYVIVAVNKMDDKTVEWDKSRFDLIVSKLTDSMTKEIGYKQDQFCFIPIAALTGYNVKVREDDDMAVEKDGATDKRGWVTGNTLFQQLDAVPLPERNETDAFRLPVIDRYKSKSVVASGKLEKGVIREGQKVIIMPSNTPAKIQSIFVEENKIRTAVPGDNIRVALSGITTVSDVLPGSVLCPEGSLCAVCDKVMVKVRITSFAPKVVAPGFRAVCHIHCETVPVSFGQFKEVTKQGQKGKRLAFVGPDTTALTILEFERPICVETYKSFPQMGRFVIRKEGFTIAIGIVEGLPSKNK